MKDPRNWASLNIDCREVAALLIAAGGPICFFQLPLTQGLVYGSADTANFFYVMKRWFWDRIGHGDFPFWNDQLFQGVYQVASPALELYSPLVAPFYLIFSDYRAMLASIFLAAFLAGISSYGFARRLGLRPVWALVASLPYGFGGLFLSLADRSAWLMSFALYPFLAWAILELCEGLRVRAFGASMLLWGLLIHHGAWVDIAGLVPFALFYAAGVGFRGSKKRLEPALWVLLSLFGGVALGMILLAPTFYNQIWMARGLGVSLTEAQYWSMHPARLWNILSPEYWGQPWDKTFWGDAISHSHKIPRFWFHSIHWGIPAFLWALYGLKLHGWRWRWLGAWALFLLVLSFGKFTPLHAWVYEVSAGFRNLRYPEKWFLPVWLFVYLFSMVGLRHLVRQESAKVWAFFCLLCAALMAVVPLINQLTFPDVAYFELLAHRGINTLKVALGMKRAQDLRFGLALVFVGLAYFLVKRPGFLRVMPALMVVLVGLELVVLAPAPIVYSPEALRMPQPVAAELSRELPQHQRWVQRRGLARPGLRHNWGILQGARFAFGYGSLEPPWYPRYQQEHIFVSLGEMRALHVGGLVSSFSTRSAATRRFVQAESLTPHLMLEQDDVVVSHFLNPFGHLEFFHQVYLADSEPTAFQALRLRGTDSDPGIVQHGQAFLEGKKISLSHPLWEKLQALETSFVLDEEEQVSCEALSRESPIIPTDWSVLAQDIRPERIRLKVSVPKAGVLLVKEGFHPFWEVTVNDTPTPVLLTDVFGRGVYLAAGTHDIHFYFVPRGFWLGATVSLLALVLCMLFLFSHRRLLVFTQPPRSRRMV
jgi:hypothetical protein